MKYLHKTRLLARDSIELMYSVVTVVLNWTSAHHVVPIYQLNHYTLKIFKYFALQSSIDSYPFCTTSSSENFKTNLTGSQSFNEYFSQQR